MCLTLRHSISLAHETRAGKLTRLAFQYVERRVSGLKLWPTVNTGTWIAMHNSKKKKKKKKMKIIYVERRLSKGYKQK